MHAPCRRRVTRPLRHGLFQSSHPANILQIVESRAESLSVREVSCERFSGSHCGQFRGRLSSGCIDRRVHIHSVTEANDAKKPF